MLLLRPPSTAALLHPRRDGAVSRTMLRPPSPAALSYPRRDGAMSPNYAPAAVRGGVIVSMPGRRDEHSCEH